MRFWTAGFVGWAACAVPEPTPDAQAGPPPVLVLEVWPVATGAPIRARARSSAPAQVAGGMALAASMTRAPRPGCAVSPTDDCLSPGPAPSIIDTQRIVGDEAVFFAPAPPQIVAGQRWWLQAGAIVRGRQVVTPAVEVTVLDGALDPDGDGLSTADEITRATDLANPDSDGDGLLDGADPMPLRPAHEIACLDGVDEDRDHLLDCEDDDCFGDARCEEQSCTDGQDDDGDGTIDCADPDCWGPGCESPGWAAWVTDGTMQVDRPSYNDTTNSTRHGGWLHGNYPIEAHADGVRGVLRSVDAAGVPHTCAWSVNRADIEVSTITGHHEGVPGWPFTGLRRTVTTTHSSYGVPRHVSREQLWDTQIGFWRLLERRDVAEVQRQGFQIQPGCRFTQADFLPDFLDIRDAPFTVTPWAGCEQRAVAWDVSGQTWYAGLNVRAWYPRRGHHGNDPLACVGQTDTRQVTDALRAASARGECTPGGTPATRHRWTDQALGVCGP